MLLERKKKKKNNYLLIQQKIYCFCPSDQTSINPTTTVAGITKARAL
jgi:hypothetical protein